MLQPQSIKRVKSILTCILITVIYLNGQECYSQKKKFKKGETIQLRDSLTAYSQSDMFVFPNVNRIRFYSNPQQLKHIQQLQTENKEQEMYVALKEYVKNFGAENFAENVPMIWKLAQLSEKFGPKGESVLLYKLVLKHHQQGIDINKLYKKYDSIEADKKEYYVPLQHYYELVNYRKEIDTLRPPHSVLTPMGENINSTKKIMVRPLEM